MQRSHKHDMEIYFDDMPIMVKFELTLHHAVRVQNHASLTRHKNYNIILGVRDLIDDLQVPGRQYLAEYVQIKMLKIFGKKTT